MKPSEPAAGETRLAEPFAFALVTWPAAAAAVHLAASDNPGWQIAALAWLALFHLAAYRRGRGIAFGNLMLLQSAVVALTWWAFPSLWCIAALPALLIGLHAAQRANLRPAIPPAGRPPADIEDSRKS